MRRKDIVNKAQTLVNAEKLSAEKTEIITFKNWLVNVLLKKFFYQSVVTIKKIKYHQ